MNVFLYGPSGSGKSTVGGLLASRLNRQWFDLDAEIEQSAGQDTDALFRDLGEAGFRDLESQSLLRVIQNDPRAVVSLGGGALLRPENRELAEKNGRVLLLSGSLETLAERLLADPHVRPLVKANPRQRLAELLARRGEHYASFGSPILTDELSPQQIVREIQVRLGAFRVSGMGEPYDVLIQPGSLDRLGDCMRERGIQGPVALVVDQNVDPLYSARALASLSAAGIEASKVVIPAGEQTKTIQTVALIWEGCLKAGVERKSAVVALGGGVTGDLAGFAAATYLRGVPWVNVPTTLLSMVDSSLGGKTGADLPQGKNLIGAFHSPALVLADPQVLATLPPAELRSGISETLKTGIIADPILYQLISTGWPQEIEAQTAIISRSMAVKADVIESDPYERGSRQALNFGHTIGHGIEKASAYRLSHGESVAIGMVLETRLAETIGLAEKGLADRITADLIKLGLPVAVPPGLDRQEIFNAMQLDKKRSQKRLPFALPERIGLCRTGVIIDNWQQLLQF